MHICTFANHLINSLYLPFGESMADQRITASYSSRYTFTGKEQDALTGLHYFGARYYDARISLWYGVDPLADEFSGWSPYNYSLNNPINMIDPDGRAPDWIYDQQKDGSYKRREGTANDGGANNHTYINRDGTTHYYNQKENTVVSVKHADIQKKIENFSKAVEKRREIVKKTGEVVNNIGDGIAAVGYVAAPFTEGASLSIAAIGEGVALGGKVITNAVNFEESGMTKDNFTNLGVDVALELAPKPLENALKKANLDQIVRNTDPTPITNIVQSSIGKVKLTTDYVVKKQLEENK